MAYSTLGLAYALIVFGAIVRISGSGMGCGDHWPRCYGSWFPPLDQPTLVIEWTHRLLAAITVAMVAALVLLALRRRSEAGVGGRGGVLRAASLDPSDGYPARPRAARLRRVRRAAALH
jgi:cytochrome c oxidase assembly protein subunit 15